ncbi:hypothetical protein UC8_33390 [Roseimaritima ulvae]|uniref:Uncharacterized protein n=1 Tax=Roseimaritima ulvae TaxID=980254 RepID=A0A5B9QU85_9BACT|nr:hypothetical protein UC8_33390 [Roseimaritima ulvae]
MLVKLLKCQICGHRFEIEVYDRRDPNEKDIPGYPICCERCNSGRLEEVRVIRRAG